MTNKKCTACGSEKLAEGALSPNQRAWIDYNDAKTSINVQKGMSSILNWPKKTLLTNSYRCEICGHIEFFVSK